MIDDIKCDKLQARNFHVSAHLDVFMDGHSYEVPAEIGVINDTCKYWVYTQDTTGTIHIDAPQERQFTLSQFFDIWKATSNLPPIGTPTIYINGQKTLSDLNNITIRSHDEIVVIYGSKPSIIPTLYQFPPSL